MRITKEELTERIKTRNLPSAVICYGQEEFFHSEILAALRSSYAGSDAWGYEVADAASLDPAGLAASAATLSFGGETKITVVRSAHKLGKNQLTALEKIAKHPRGGCVAVLMAEKELKTTDSLLKWAKEHNIALCHLAVPKPKELGSWLKSQASLRGFSLDRETIDFMLDLSTGNLMALSQMLDKIDLYRGERQTLSLKDIEDLLQDSFEKSVYDCVRATFDRNREKAAAELYRLLRFSTTDGILQIVRALAREGFALLKYHELRGKGTSTEGIAKELRLGTRKWLLEREYPERTRKWTSKRLHQLLTRLAEVDFAVRVSGRDPEAMLEQIVIGNLAPTSVEEIDEVFV